VIRSDGRIPMKNWFEVTANNYPTTFKVFEMISHDMGAGAGHTNYSVPEKWVPYLQDAERFLSKMSNENLENFTIGDQGEVDKITKYDSQALFVSNMLNSFFNDWED
jgi:hypothetical protein